MSVNLLHDIRKSTDRYLNECVNVTIGPIKEPGKHVDPNETFVFKINATNTGGIRLKNVRLRVWVEDQNVAQLSIEGDFFSFESSGGVFKATNANDLEGNDILKFQLKSGFQVNFPENHQWNSIGPNEALNELTIKGRAGSTAAGGNSEVKARLIADIDPDYLFPKGQLSDSASRDIEVFG